LDATGFAPSHVLTPDEEHDLAVLKAARHRIRYRWRWWQMGRPTLWPVLFSGNCAVTAVARVTDDLGISYMRVVLRLLHQLPPGWSSVQGYNDASTTKHADVLALFDRAIADLEPGE
jgi:hypothetical protein